MIFSALAASAADGLAAPQAWLGAMQLWNLPSVFLSYPQLIQHLHTSLGGFRNTFLSSPGWGCPGLSGTAAL